MNSSKGAAFRNSFVSQCCGRCCPAVIGFVSKFPCAALHAGRWFCFVILPAGQLALHGNSPAPLHQARPWRCFAIPEAGYVLDSGNCYGSSSDGAVPLDCAARLRTASGSGTKVQCASPTKCCETVPARVKHIPSFPKQPDASTKAAPFPKSINYRLTPYRS